MGPGKVVLVTLFRTACLCREAGSRVYRHFDNRFRLDEIDRRSGCQRRTHELLPDRRRNRSAGKALPARSGEIVPDPDACHYLRRIADEPGVTVIIGGAGLAGGRTLLTETF